MAFVLCLVLKDDVGTENLIKTKPRLLPALIVVYLLVGVTPITFILLLHRRNYEQNKQNERKSNEAEEQEAQEEEDDANDDDSSVISDESYRDYYSEGSVSPNSLNGALISKTPENK